MALTRVTSGGIAPGVEIKFDQNNTPTTPAISFEGDLDTGIYSPTADTIAIATGGVKRFEIGPNGELTVGTSGNPVYLPVTNSQGSNGNPANGKTLYVNINDSLADDSIDNNGENLNRPFRSIERALIQAARVSYVVGTGSQSGAAGADQFEYTTIIVYPGQYEIDNRPGEFVGSFNSGSPADSYQGDYSTVLTAGSLSPSDFYKFNSLNGGVIVPRGTSIVGLDLRKTIIRPKYIPDAATGTEAAIFNLTGGCYIWQMTIKDAVGQPYYNKSQQYSNAQRSHHKLVGFKFATVGDLASYYRKVDHVDTNIPNSGSSVYELFQRVEENRIVGDSTNTSTIDSVASASPYVFNCSLRSVWAMCGMHADGNDATGFRSMVVAQFTGVSLQSDDRAFYLNGVTTNDINASDNRAQNPLSQYVKEWRHYHIKSSNSSFIQIVSVFAVGYADHFVADEGGDLSITNSNSNFGNTSLRSIGFQNNVFTQNNRGKITAVIPPRGINPSNQQNISESTLGFVNVQQTLGVTNQEDTEGTNLNANNPNFKVVYLGTPIKRREITEIKVKEGGTDRRYLVLGNSFQYTLGKKVSNLIGTEKIYLNVEGTLLSEDIVTANRPADPSNNLYDNDERFGYGWTPAESGTVTDETEGFLYIKLTYPPTTDGGILSKTNGIFKVNTIVTENTQTDEEGNTVVVSTTTESSYEYFYGLTTQPYITRLKDTRGIAGGSDLLWRLEYKIDKSEINAKAPERRFVLFPNNTDNSAFDKALWIYDVEIYQEYKQNVQDGIYYLTVLKGDVDALESSVNGSSTNDYPISQNINYLYPTINQDDPVWNPIASTSKVLVDDSIASNPRSKNIAINYIDSSDPSNYPYATPDLYSITRESIADYLTFTGVSLPSGFALSTPYSSDTASNTNGKELPVKDRKVNLSNPPYIALKRSSIIRASSHTWEYMGFGPGNYSTAFPSAQTFLPDTFDIINSQGVENNGGFTASTGTNSQGEFYIGNQVIRAGTDETETLNVPKIKYSSETRLIDYTDISNQLTNSLITNTAQLLADQLGTQLSNVQTQLQDQISGLANNFSSKNITASTSLNSPSKTTIGGELIINIDGINTSNIENFPTASTDGYGFAKKASDYNDSTDSDGFITPSDLEQWRISKGIATTSTTTTSLNYICIQPDISTSITSSITASATSIPVASVDGFEDSGLIQIEAEVIRYNSVTRNSDGSGTLICSVADRGSVDPMTGSATTADSHDQGRSVTFANLFWWEEPYRGASDTTTQYKSPAKVSAYTSSNITAYIDDGFVPNPQAAKDYGVKLQASGSSIIGITNKKFRPFSNMAQAAEWANANGFTGNDTVFLRFKPGYYKLEGTFTPKVSIQGATVSNDSIGDANHMGSFLKNDGKYNNSVFLHLTDTIADSYVINDTVVRGNLSGGATFDNGLDLQRVHCIGFSDQLKRWGVKTSGNFAAAAARNFVRLDATTTLTSTKSPINEYLYKWALDRRNSYLNTRTGTLFAGISNSANQLTVVINSGDLGYIPAKGYFKIGSGNVGDAGVEVVKYEVLDSADPNGVKVSITSRGLDTTTATTHNTGDNIYFYYGYTFVTDSNKFKTVGWGSNAYPFTANGREFYLRECTLAPWVGGYYARVSNTSVQISGCRFRGNERVDIADGFSYYSDPNQSMEYYQFCNRFLITTGDVTIRVGDSSSVTTGSYLPQTDPLYTVFPNRSYYTSSHNNYLEPYTDSNGDLIEHDRRTGNTRLKVALTTTDNQIVIGPEGEIWPNDGSGIINEFEEFTYTGKTTSGQNWVLTGVTRNTSQLKGTSQGTGGAWYVNAPVTISDPARFTSWDGSKWDYLQSGRESGSVWHRRGPQIGAFYYSSGGSKITIPDYSSWHEWSGGNSVYTRAGWVGQFGYHPENDLPTTNNFEADGFHPRESAGFISDGSDFELVQGNQYHHSWWSVTTGTSRSVPGFGVGSITLASDITDTETNITFAGDYENLKYGTIRIGNEMMRIESYSGANFVVTRGHLRSVATSHTAGDSIVGAFSGTGSLTRVQYSTLNLHVSPIYFGTDFTDNTKCGRIYKTGSVYGQYVL